MNDPGISDERGKDFIPPVRLTEVSKRQQKYWQIDGLGLILNGIGLALWSGAFSVVQTIPKGASWLPYWILAGLAIAGILLGVDKIMEWMVEKLRQRITYPRVGYIARLEAPGDSWTMPIMAAAIVAIVVLYGTGVKHLIPGLLIAWGLLQGVLALRKKLWGLLFLSAFEIAIGGLWYRVGTPFDGFGVSLWVMGCYSVLFGLWRLWRFIRTNRRLGDTEG